MAEKMTYRDAGVDYKTMDSFKRKAQLTALKTAKELRRFGFSEVKMSRGESAYLIETPDSYLAHVEEGLGTKNLVADEMYKLTGKTFYDHIAQDTVAMIVNDMITLGALPLSVAMHLAVGESKWFDDQKRINDLINGWKMACDFARCAWGGGETPTLKDIIYPETVVLSGSAIGIIQPKERLIEPQKIQKGDAIVFIESSGIHANGLTLARSIAPKLSNSYLTLLPDGRTFGKSLLCPTNIYVPIINDCLESGIDIHYAINITGHGWRKLMRAPQHFAYIIEEIPEPQLIFQFIQQHGPVDDQEAYANFNMGAGFALYVDLSEVDQIIAICDHYFMKAWKAGYIDQSKEKKLIIKPKGLEYLGSTLKVRAK